MTDNKPKTEKKNESKQEKNVEVSINKMDKPVVDKVVTPNAIENKQNDKPIAANTKDKNKSVKVEKIKKEEAIAKGTNMSASKKHCMYICTFIKNKPIDLAIRELQDVIAMKRPIPFKGEIPHRSYPGMMSGRYPVNASKEFIYLLKALKGNVIVNGIDLDKARISFASATWASRASRRGGTRFKRAFVLLKAKEFTAKEKTKENKK